mmetsp:Transcript_4312/g.9280  ORF Transcript_4312/g.9280 Transcript_4312/m.9280 type:complete len:449 (+) Transcript_4312:366-1712(+)
MKFLLLKLTSLALVAATGAHALGERQALRGLVENDQVLVDLQGPCEDGVKEGRRQVRSLWRGMGEDCNKVWDLKQAANRMSTRKFRDTRGASWQTKSENRCAREEVLNEVNRIEKTCLEDDSSQCSALGEAAAEEVVLGNFCTIARMESQNDEGKRPNWRKQCKNAAYSICEGQITTVKNRWCRSQRMSTSKLRELQGMCRRQVNSMVNGEGDGMQDSDVSADAAVLVSEDKKKSKRKRNICRKSNLKSSRDRKTCRRLRREVCDDRKMRKRHRKFCRFAGFATVAEGAAEDAPETYADDAEIFSDEEADGYDMIIEDIEEELEDEDSADDESDADVLVDEDKKKSRRKRNICRRMRNSRDRKTCQRMRRDLCDNRRMRKRNRKLCIYAGFALVAEGAAGPGTYADDIDIFSTEEANRYDMIIQDIEEELEEGEKDDVGFVAWTFLPV